MRPDPRGLPAEIAVARTATDAEHIVPPIEEGSTEQFDWYTMPHCTDGSFRPLLTKAGGSQAVGLRVLADVADGLATLHERGIVHRDVYQENVLLHEDRGLITDLGAARRLDTPRGPAARGPEVHWPPEYATSYSTATPAADVFSLAVLTYRYLCADILRHRHSRLETAPAALRPLLSAALVPEPKDRTETGELRDGLRHPATPTTAPHRAVTDTIL
ncbi:protein kinase domain-containing protein [Streptomyces sp. NBC_01014]|uniref:protein kinase domain-containing protein n=1 Tax=Streptomyces sp. NBC_01014 TaxID=2903719 RepID=UPI00386B6FAD|nr:protein kinase [Streptomyces sp. NBC_01014]